MRTRATSPHLPSRRSAVQPTRLVLLLGGLAPLLLALAAWRGENATPLHCCAACNASSEGGSLILKRLLGPERGAPPSELGCDAFDGGLAAKPIRPSMLPMNWLAWSSRLASVESVSPPLPMPTPPPTPPCGDSEFGATSESLLFERPRAR